jgi:hypothetical protein
VQHELFHALGFGHTCEFPSLMYYSPQDSAVGCREGANGRFASVPTANDVAYLRVLCGTLELLTVIGPAWNLLEAANGERVLRDGRPPF